ncbi:hypothetical protein V9T40_008019 [Parthenolecanium corni]|uniref:Uncharacterized protein n=1 Tax=Parthenolecanium corni TaxID=536013 RepID=A0AAN9TNP4_9HEMI
MYLSSPLDASNEVSPAHRKLKYRRLSDAKHKEVREKFMKICRSDNSNERRYHSFSPTNAILEGSGELHGASSREKLKKPNKEVDQSKPSASTRSPDLKRLMNRVVRDFRGTKSKVANGVKTSEDSTSKCDNRVPGNSSRPQNKETKSSSWMAMLFQNIRLRSTSHDTDSQ